MNGLRAGSSAIAGLAIVGALIVAPGAGVSVAVTPTTFKAVAIAANPVSPHTQKLSLSGVDSRALKSAPQAQLQSADGAMSAAPALVPAVLSPQATTQHFTMMGVTWDSGSATGVTVQVRVREKQGWSDWQALVQDDAGADKGSVDDTHAAGTAGTEVLDTAGADGVQVEVLTDGNTVPTDVQAVLIDPGTSASDNDVPAAPVANVTTPVPWIVTRAGWGADESLRTCVPATDSSVQIAFVHHTVSANHYSADDVPALIRGMYAYHVQGRGWCDIGYNFLVDRFGRIFEGRYGGVDKGVVGAQTEGFNSVSFGVAAIGDYSAAEPSSAMVDGIEHIVAWKLSLYGRNPLGTASVVSGGTAKFPAGTPVTLNVISGHRDANLTECPGNNLYPLLPGLRGAVAAITAQAHGPIGSLDAVIPVPGGMVISGWTLDPDSPQSPLYAWLSISGVGLATSASFNRPDVAASYAGAGPVHGYSQGVPVAPGTYTVCTWGVNVGPGTDTPLGCKSVTVGGSPLGNLEQVRAIPGGIFVSGWALDPDTTSSIYVWLSVGGVGVLTGSPYPRPDVPVYWPGYGVSHGFQMAVPTARGTFSVCALAANLGAGVNSSLGCHTVTVT